MPEQVDKVEEKDMSISEEAEIRKAEALEKLAVQAERFNDNMDKLLEGLGAVLQMYIEKTT